MYLLGLTRQNGSIVERTLEAAEWEWEGRAGSRNISAEFRAARMAVSRRGSLRADLLVVWLSAKMGCWKVASAALSSPVPWDMMPLAYSIRHIVASLTLVPNSDTVDRSSLSV